MPNSFRTRRKRLVHANLALALLLVLVLIALVLKWRAHEQTRNTSEHSSYLSVIDLQPLESREREPMSPREVTNPRVVIAAAGSDVNNLHCTMGSCFDVSRCLDDFKVYVYPSISQEKSSSVHKRILKVIRASPYFTTDPNQACLFVPSLDSLDRDELSKEYVRGFTKKLNKLEHWNGGENHLVFNFFSGTFPEYSNSLDFDHGKAILAKASFSTDQYRAGFDISLPLLHASHKEKGVHQGDLGTIGNLFPIHRELLLVFKGKRYLWGLGSETRNAIHHLHNGDDIVMLTTCRHTKYWSQHQDDRCNDDNTLYDQYDYHELIKNSTFCLVPRGRRLGSFRFIESLQAACIPVSLSNGLVLPFEEVIDWRKVALVLDERNLFQVPEIVRNIPPGRILAMRIQTQLIWEQYFSSVERVVFTALEIIRERVQRARGHMVWNRAPGAFSVSPQFSQDISSYPFYAQEVAVPIPKYTAVIRVTTPSLRGDSPAVRLIKNICNAQHLDKIVVLWIGEGHARVMTTPPHCTAPIYLIDRPGTNEHATRLVEPPPDNLTTDAILSLSEDTDLVEDEAEFGFSVWQSYPSRLVGFTAHRHNWDTVRRQWTYSARPANTYSVVVSAAMFYHRYYGYLIQNGLAPSIKSIADNSLPCLDLTMNFLVSQITSKPPLKVTGRMSLQVSPPQQQHLRKPTESDLSTARTSCLNMLANAFGYIPLKYSTIRANPVLFRDNVSISRKEYKRLESR